MYQQTYKGINSCLIDLCQQLKKHGVPRNTRGQHCIEFPEPVLLKIEQPTARWITLPERKWNLFLPYAESLWIASGSNNLKFISHYLSGMHEFSDDKQSIRAGYGPRLRSYDGLDLDMVYPNLTAKYTTNDQFAYLEQLLKQDPTSRRGLMTIGNPLKDQLDVKSGQLKVTKDYPCTCTLHFYLNVNNALDLIVHMRSNDLIWGLSAVNVFNFTFMQEYFAAILQVPLGHYYHSVNNLHYYQRHEGMVSALASYNFEEVDNPSFEYTKQFGSLKDFDGNVQQLLQIEKGYRKAGGVETTSVLSSFGRQEAFFEDWNKILSIKNGHKAVEFENPILTALYSHLRSA